MAKPDCLQIIYSENIGFSSWFVNRKFNKVCKHLCTIHSTIQICGNYLKLNVVFAAQHFYLMTNRYIITIKEQEFLCEKRVIEFSIISACRSQQESFIIWRRKLIVHDEIKFSSLEYKKELKKIVHLNLHVYVYL